MTPRLSVTNTPPEQSGTDWVDSEKKLHTRKIQKWALQNAPWNKQKCAHAHSKDGSIFKLCELEG